MWRANVDGSDVKPLFEGDFVHGPVLALGDLEVVFSVNRGVEQRELWLAPVAGGPPHRTISTQFRVALARVLSDARRYVSRRRPPRRSVPPEVQLVQRNGISAQVVVECGSVAV